MIKSMTAFARQSVQTEKGQLTWELRSVNHRYSEVSMRLPDEFRALEPKIREKTSKLVKRGKLDLNLRLQRDEQQSMDKLELDTALVAQLTAAAGELGKQLDNPQPMTVAEILSWPGMLRAPKTDGELAQQQAMQLLDLALEELIATREREGEQMRKVILVRCESVREQVKTVKAFLPEIITIIRDRVQKKLNEFDVSIDEGRLEQEIVIMANRADVAEEVDRLDAHIIEIERVLQQDQPVGRRLDFLMQELNREANTLGSKAVATPISQASIELKVLIEQMREQIQNIE